MIKTRVALLLCGLTLGSAGCAGGGRLSSRDLSRISHPAFVGRIEEQAGPKSEVFRTDKAYEAQLRRLDPKEADRRLQAKLARGMSRWEVAERLRAATFAKLPKNQPWTQAVDPVAVARAFQSYLVEEVPVNEPDYRLLRPMGADSVLEFVIQEYGVVSRNGKAAAYVRGFGRLFKLKGGTLWHRAFAADGLKAEGTTLDPFKVAKDPMLYKEAMNALVDSVADQFARELTPKDAVQGISEGSGGAAEQQEQETELPSSEPDPL